AERCFYNDDETNAFSYVSESVTKVKRIYEFVNKSAGTYGLGGTPILPEDLLLIYDGDVTGITPEQAAAIETNTAKVGITPEQAAAIIANSDKIGITPEQAAAIIEATNKTIEAVSVTGDANKTITLTREDGTILTASFLDIDTEGPDDVINTLTFNTGNGTLVAITSEGAVISVSLDGRSSLLRHSHLAAAITDLDAAVAANSAVALNTAKVTNATHTGDVTGATVLTITDRAITTGKIADYSVSNSKINAAAVSTRKIADGAVVTSKIADSAVAGSKLSPGAVNGEKIDNNAVTQSKISDGAVVNSKIANGAVNNAKLNDMPSKTYKGRTSDTQGDP